MSPSVRTAITVAVAAPALALSAATVGADDVPQEKAMGVALYVPRETDPRGSFGVSDRRLSRERFATLAADPAALRETVAVYVVAGPEHEDAPPRDRPPLLGTYTVDPEKRTVGFLPRFPLEPGVHYRLVYRDPTARGRFLTHTLSVPALARSVPTTRVVRVAPAGDVLPENLLKFYIHFSAPMGRGSAYEHVALLDESGRALDLPFLELGEELWGPNQQRFTLLFDPGRIKTGLKPREELGPVLRAGRTYTLVVDRRWRDAAGLPLAEGFRKTFRVGPPDATPPDPKAWTLTTPAAGTRAALVVRFPEPLDRALLERTLAVAGADGKPVAGRTAVHGDETAWSFWPEAPWGAGAYTLRVDRTLEDRAGNAIGRPFEVDVFRAVQRRETAEAVTVPFTVGPAAR